MVEKNRSPKDEEALRQYIMAEEDRRRLTPEKWGGGYRWFRSPNIVCLEHYRVSPPSAPKQKAS
jgi:hypothetical protein